MALSEGAAAIISSAIAAGGSVASGVAQSSMNKQTREFNSQQAYIQRLWNEYMLDKQNALNLDLWNRENAYNTPSAQVQRLRDAGLNPLYYGLDGSSAGDISSAQPLAYERASIDNLVNPVSAGIDSAVKIAQISNIQADTAKKNNENLTETQRREKLLADIDVVKQELLNKRSQQNLTDKQVEELDKKIAWMDRLNEAVLSEKEASAALSRSQKKRIDELLEGEKLLQSKTLDDFEKRWKKIDAEIKKMSKETGLLQKDIENYALNHSQPGFMGTGLSIPNIIRGLFGLEEPSNEERRRYNNPEPGLEDELRRTGQ